MNHELVGRRDVYFSYHYLTNIGPRSQSLSRQRSRIERKLREADGKMIRTGSRRTAALDFEECLFMRPNSAGGPIFQFTLEVNGEHGDAHHPLLIVDLVTGVEHPRPVRTLEEAANDKDDVRSSLSESQAVALWDQVTRTLRPRPGAF